MRNPLFAAGYAAAAASDHPSTLIQAAVEPTRVAFTGSQAIPGAKAPDPYRRLQDWAASGRGRARKVQFISSYTGARLAGDILLPPADVQGPYPGVIVITGATQQYRQQYLWLSQGLAEGGYQVLTYDPQGSGESESFHHTDEGGSFCTSRGCPGDFAPGSVSSVSWGETALIEYGVRDALRFFLSTPASPYAPQVVNTAGTALYNPEHQNLDRTVYGGGMTPLALVGHSIGGARASDIGQADYRVAAIVSLDSPGAINPRAPDDPVGRAHAPTLALYGDYGIFPEYYSAPPNPLNKLVLYGQLRNLCTSGKQCIDVMSMGLRAAGHYDYTYVPYGRAATRYGERVAFYYIRSWLDAYVKGLSSSSIKTAAAARLTASSFDGSADSSSIGTGTMDLSSGSPVNKPYLISGKTVKDRLSFYFRSAYYIRDGGQTYDCVDVRAGC